ncbi:hypothetical protein TD95_003790 [Thielaviopsis punctulata]|uniref:Uncharacterized protein n=1 Tax=Thielaviopsis punctulata TaxID=72032 RepID=A0A0F4ZDN4_9PEZI|nr:hypothetical protein TD95_003790 [Thielaviopsis punctulata]
MIQYARNADNRHKTGGLDKRNPFDNEGKSPFEECVEILTEIATNLWKMMLNNGIPALAASARRLLWYASRHLSPRRVFSFPHVLVIIWVIVLLRGERWVFYYKVNHCLWDKWEEWPADAKPHHLVFIADPQLIDPHSYPGRPWPINPLTMTITDNYLRRGYHELQTQLQPDSLFFLGDLFDGGREWKTEKGDFKDAPWAKPHPKGEAEYVTSWLKKYRDDFWLREYKRFSDIFFKPYESGGFAHDASRGRKVVASLPGNHDLGFGSDVKVPVRDRFAAYFGEPNRIDIIGNHSIVSVDTVSLSAGTSDRASPEKLKHIFGPAREFLDGVKDAKLRAIEDQLHFWANEPNSHPFNGKIEDADTIKPDSGGARNVSGVTDFPTILLTHVPLYRLPGTPCGPMREHWPPAKHPKEENGRIVDDGNAITVAAGYQYQNVLSEDDSVRLINSVGNVVHVFSGDDHDYCELVHSHSKNNVREITVKSMSMAMGVPTPGFLMVSLWNPVDGTGASLLESAGTNRLATMQTHLCLLPNQIRTYFAYIYLGIFTVVALAIRAFLVPVLRLTPFAMDLDASDRAAAGYLPLYKDKVEDTENATGTYNGAHGGGYSSSGSYSRSLPTRAGSTHTNTRSRDVSNSNNSASAPRGSSRNGKNKHRNGSSVGGSAWGWAGKEPRIEINRDNLFGGPLPSQGSLWRAASGRPRITAGFIAKELWASLWRVVWMTFLMFAYLTYEG